MGTLHRGSSDRHDDTTGSEFGFLEASQRNRFGLDRIFHRRQGCNSESYGQSVCIAKMNPLKKLDNWIAQRLIQKPPITQAQLHYVFQPGSGGFTIDIYTGVPPSPPTPPGSIDMLNLSVYASLTNALAATTAAIFGMTLDRTITFVSLAFTVYVATTNNGTNYWTLTLKDAAGNTIATVDTKAISANTYSVLTTSSFSPISLGIADKGIYVSATKTASPGTLSVLPPVLIGT